MNAGLDLGRACSRRRAAIASTVARRCASRNLIRLPMVCPRRLEKSPIVRADRNSEWRNQAHERRSISAHIPEKACPELVLGGHRLSTWECAKYTRRCSAHCGEIEDWARWPAYKIVIVWRPAEHPRHDRQGGRGLQVAGEAWADISTARELVRPGANRRFCDDHHIACTERALIVHFSRARWRSALTGRKSHHLQHVRCPPTVRKRS